MYWLSVNKFPLDFRQRRWLLEFADRLSETLRKDKQTPEHFLSLKYTRTDLNERFTNTMLRYRPMAGIMLAPGQGLPETPTSLEIKELTESHNDEGLINLDHLVPEYAGWFAGGTEAELRQDFFGAGGMVILWLDAGQEPSAPKFDVPPVLRSHPAMQGMDMEGQMAKGMRLQHPFLRRSREVFGAHLPDGPVKRHALFIAPKLNSQDVVAATANTRAAWFELFSAYLSECPENRGILLMLRNPEFDEELISLLQAMRDGGKEFPL